MSSSQFQISARQCWRMPVWLLSLCAASSAWAEVRVSPVTFVSQTAVEQAGITLDGWVFTSNDEVRGPLSPAVVMMHGCAGPYSSSKPSRGLANQFEYWGPKLADAGYIVLLVDSFTPRYRAEDPNGDPQDLEGRNECNNGAGGISEVHQRSYDAHEALEFITSQGFQEQFGAVAPDDVVLMGWSHGGSTTIAALDETLHGATTPRFRAAVANYPGCGLWGEIDDYKPYAPLLFLHAETDPLYRDSPSIPDDCEERIEEAKAVPGFDTFFEMVVYEDAGHSFDFGGQSGSDEGNARARTHARELIMEFFDIHARGIGTLESSQFAQGSYLFSTVPLKAQLPPRPVVGPLTGIVVNPLAVALDLASLIGAPLPQYSGTTTWSAPALPAGLALSDGVISGTVDAFDEDGTVRFVVHAENDDGVLIQEIRIANDGAVSLGAGFVLPLGVQAQVPSAGGTIDLPLAGLVRSTDGIPVSFSGGQMPAGLAVVDGRLLGAASPASLPLQTEIIMDSGGKRVVLGLQLAALAEDPSRYSVTWVGDPQVSDTPGDVPVPPGDDPVPPPNQPPPDTQPVPPPDTQPVPPPDTQPVPPPDTQPVPPPNNGTSPPPSAGSGARSGGGGAMNGALWFSLMGLLGMRRRQRANSRSRGLCRKHEGA